LDEDEDESSLKESRFPMMGYPAPGPGGKEGLVATVEMSKPTHKLRYQGALTELESLLVLERRELGNFYLGIGDIRLAFEGPKRTPTNGILVAHVNVVVRERDWEVRHGQAHHLRRLAASGDRRATTMVRVGALG